MRTLLFALAAVCMVATPAAGQDDAPAEPTTSEPSSECAEKECAAEELPAVTLEQFVRLCDAFKMSAAERILREIEAGVILAERFNVSEENIARVINMAIDRDRHIEEICRPFTTPDVTNVQEEPSA